MKKKYYDGFNVIDILFKNLDSKKVLKVLEGFAESDGVDAVEVVRCKDCKYWGDDGYNEGCRYSTEIVTAEDYCSRAERKEQ